jgi:outer membrane protein OmpA-like peptidoglycan-associated protein
LALAAELQNDLGRNYSLRQIRQIRQVRELAPEIELDAITFSSGSAAIEPDQAKELSALGRAMVSVIEKRPAEVFLIEGHTDAVGSASLNLALSDRRAETVALALAEFFGVPPENMITQGYGESFLKVPTLTDELANRRVTVRRITPLLRQTASSR